MTRKKRVPKYISPYIIRLRTLDAKLEGKEDYTFTLEEAREYQRLAELRNQEIWDSMPRLQCCDAAKEYFPMRFSVYGKEPGWRIQEYDELRRYYPDQDKIYSIEHLDNEPHARFCPYCGAPVPKMRPRGKPIPGVSDWDSETGYCGTCAERDNYCVCLPSECAYEVDPQ